MRRSATPTKIKTPPKTPTKNRGDESPSRTVEDYSPSPGKAAQHQAKFKKFKAGVQTIEDVVYLLSKVEAGEERLLQIIFDGKNSEAANLRREIMEIKEHFKLCCHVIIGEMHHDDVATDSPSSPTSTRACTWNSTGTFLSGQRSSNRYKNKLGNRWRH